MSPFINNLAGKFTGLLNAEHGFEDIAQGGRESYAVRKAAPSSLVNMEMINNNLMNTVQQVLLDSQRTRIDGVEDVDIPDKRRLTFGKGAFTRPNRAMIGLAIGGELGDLLVDYIKQR